MVASCGQVGVEPFDYLREVLAELPKRGRKPSEAQLQPWLPAEWKKRKAELRGPPVQEAGSKQEGQEQGQAASV